MRHDPTASLYYDDGALDRYLDFVLAAVDRERARPRHRARLQRAVRVPRRHRRTQRIAARRLGRGDPLGRRGLARRAAADRGQRAGNPCSRRLSRPRHLAADAAGDDRQYLGPRLCRSLRAVAAERQASRAADARSPNTSRATRADGLPLDSWLRTHVRVGARIVKIAPYSMVIRRHAGRMVGLDRHALRPQRRGRGCRRAVAGACLAASRTTPSISSPISGCITADLTRGGHHGRRLTSALTGSPPSTPRTIPRTRSTTTPPPAASASAAGWCPGSTSTAT